MKTSKRKRATKTAAAAEAPAVDVIAADTPTALEPAVQVTAELSPAAVEALVAEPVVETHINEIAVAAAETVDAHAETIVAEPVVVLNSNCSVKDAAALKVSLCAVAKHSDAVILDVSAVERVDTATMQLLCAFVLDRSGRQQIVTWRGESQVVHDAVRLLGVGALLGLESKGVAA